jgi:hypothetical protein
MLHVVLLFLKSCVDMTGTLKPDMLESMEPEGQQSKRQLDVTGLPEEAICAMQSVISLLRGKPETAHPGFSSREEWAKAVKQWAESHPRIDNPADDSRESIYAGRGE